VNATTVIVIEIKIRIIMQLRSFAVTTVAISVNIDPRYESVIEIAGKTFKFSLPFG